MKHVSTTKINDNPHTSNESIDVLLVFFLVNVDAPYAPYASIQSHSCCTSLQNCIVGKSIF